MLKKLLFTLWIASLFVTQQAQAQTKQEALKAEVIKLYIAFFERTPDNAGLTYWLESGLNIEEICESFYEQDESQTRYPSDMSEGDFVSAVYRNLFARYADPAGQHYWQRELEKETLSRVLFILAVLNGAQGTDETILANRVRVAEAYLKQDSDNLEDAKKVLEAVDESESSVNDALCAFGLDGCSTGGSTTASPSYVEPKKTGQTTVYTTNDDGSYQKGTTRSYTRDIAKETVTDHVTNLVWADDANVSSIIKNWADAASYCTALTLDGGGWRLPTRKELQSLTDYGRTNPAINPIFSNIAASAYWSSITYAGGSPVSAWIILFNKGAQSRKPKVDSYYVRCVRAGQ